jgi:hypothetical protein
MLRWRSVCLSLAVSLSLSQQQEKERKKERKKERETEVRFVCLSSLLSASRGLIPFCFPLPVVQDLLSADDAVLDDIYEWFVPPVRRLPPSER